MAFTLTMDSDHDDYPEFKRTINPELMRIIDESPYVKKAMKEFLGIDLDTDANQNTDAPDENANLATGASLEDASEKPISFTWPLSELSSTSSSASGDLSLSPPTLLGDDGSGQIPFASQSSGIIDTPLYALSPADSLAPGGSLLVPAFEHLAAANVPDVLFEIDSGVYSQPGDFSVANFTDKMQEDVFGAEQSLALSVDVPDVFATTDQWGSFPSLVPSYGDFVTDQQWLTPGNAPTLADSCSPDLTWQDPTFDISSKQHALDGTGYLPTMDDLNSVSMHMTDLNVSTPDQMPQMSYDASFPPVEYPAATFNGDQLQPDFLPASDPHTVGQLSMNMQGMYMPDQNAMFDIDASAFGTYAHDTSQPQYSELYGHLVDPMSTFYCQDIQNPLSAYAQVADIDPMAASYSQTAGPSQIPSDFSFSNNSGAYTLGSNSCIDEFYLLLNGNAQDTTPLHMQQNDVSQLAQASLPIQTSDDLMHPPTQCGDLSVPDSLDGGFTVTSEESSTHFGVPFFVNEVEEAGEATGSSPAGLICRFGNCMKPLVDCNGTIPSIRGALSQHGHLSSVCTNKKIICKWVDEETPPCRQIVDERYFPRHIGQHLGLKHVKCRFCPNGKALGFRLMQRHFKKCEGFAMMSEEKQRHEWERVTKMSFTEYQAARGNLVEKRKKRASQSKLYKKLQNEKSA